MTQSSQYREPRSQVIFRHTTEAIRNSHHNDGSFAQELADQYMARVAPEERIVQFHVGTDAASIEKAHARNAKLVERFRNGTVKLPADLEESWVAALPEPWRTDCARELARRYGFLGATAVQGQPAQQLLCTGRLSVEFGQSIQAIAAALADGKLDIADRPRLQRALKELHDLAAETATTEATIAAALADLSPPAAPVAPTPIRRTRS